LCVKNILLLLLLSDSESEEESDKASATKAAKEKGATNIHREKGGGDAPQDNSSTVASKVSDVFKRLGRKVDGADSPEEGEISENSSARYFYFIKILFFQGIQYT
jgi:hypothetical protein